MTALTTLLGTALILMALYDIFRTLFQPSRRGMFSEYVASGVWRSFRRVAHRRPRILVLAGPAAFIASSLFWGLFLALGWALLYWPRMPEAFSYSPGMDSDAYAGFSDAFYLSLVTLGTLGYGDITPDEPLLRLLGPLQALVGFLLLTAVITWLLSIYPNLARHESFAQEVTLLRNAEDRQSVDLTRLDADVAEQILGKLVSDLVAVRGNFLQFPITYYFYNDDEDSSLAVAILYVMELAERAAQEERPAEVRFQAVRLQGAIDALGETLVDRFLDISPGPSGHVFAAYARDHSHVH